MRAAPAALATVLVLSGLRTVGAEPCPPRAALDGDKVAVERVAVELQRLGVAVTSTSKKEPDAAGCSIVRAQVVLEGSGGSIAVAVHGATRGSEGRVVSDAALAAAWIDSWTRSDLDNTLWAAPSSRVATAETESEINPPSATPSSTDVVASTSSRWDRIAISADYEQTWSDDDASWSGVAGAVCVMVGQFCVGGRARAAFDPQRLYNSTGVARNDLSVLATASRPVTVGRMTIAPELGLGVGRVSTRRAENACKMVMPDPNCNAMTDPMCVPEAGMCDPTDPGTTMSPKIYVGDGFSASTYAPRVALALRVAVPVFEHVWLDGIAGFTYTPFGHGAVFAPDMSANPMTTPDAVALPGEPSSAYVLGVGIRVGAK